MKNNTLDDVRAKQIVVKRPFRLDEPRLKRDFNKGEPMFKITRLSPLIEQTMTNVNGLSIRFEEIMLAISKSHDKIICKTILNYAKEKGVTELLEVDDDQFYDFIKTYYPIWKAQKEGK